MAYLGYNGIIKFQRVSPDPVVTPGTSINKSLDCITIEQDDWLLAEEVLLVHSNGVIEGQAHRDELGRIYFHSNRDGALFNSPETRLSLSDVNDLLPVIVAVKGSPEQTAMLSVFQATLTVIDAPTEVPMRAWPAALSEYRGASEGNTWEIQGELKSWQFSRNAAEIDVGSLGEKFGTYIKATVTGSGTLDFIVDIYESSTQSDVDLLLRLVQLTEHGSTANAKFYLKQESVESCSDGKSGINSSLFFNASIMITSCGISVATEGEIKGSASFVTTGPIRLLSE